MTLLERMADEALNEHAWTEFDRKARAQESAYENAARAQFDRESSMVEEMIVSAVPNTKSLEDAITLSIVWPYLEGAFLKIFAAYSAVGTFGRQWYNRFRPIVAKTMAQAEAPSVRLGILGPTSPQIISAINRRVTRLTGNVTETTAQQIRDVMTQARADGVGVSEVVKRLRAEVFTEDKNANRATTIARTETVGALNEGAWVKATGSGVFRSKQWIANLDGRERDSHRAAHEQGWIPINDPFNNGLHYPHESGAPADEVINCRCTLKYSDLTADEANGGSP